MTAYALQKAIWEYLNPKGQPGAPVLDPDGLRARYGLSEPEITALFEGDVAALYRLGVHPVLLNGYARAHIPRERYRAALAELEREAREAEVGDVVSRPRAGEESAGRRREQTDDG